MIYFFLTRVLMFTQYGRMTWVPEFKSQLPPLTNYVTLGKLLYLSEGQFSHL